MGAACADMGAPQCESCSTIVQAAGDITGIDMQAEDSPFASVTRSLTGMSDVSGSSHLDASMGEGSSDSERRSKKIDRRQSTKKFDDWENVVDGDHVKVEGKHHHHKWIYEGAVLRGKKHGRGKYVFPGHHHGATEADREYYEGDWEDDKAYGQGVYKNKLSTYTGKWVCDMKHGHGEEDFADGARYIGEFDCGLRHGKGTLKFHDGSSYDGEFKSNRQEGQGTFKWMNKKDKQHFGHTYTGAWKDNYMNGEGVYNLPDGTSYEGQYVDGLKDGHGAFCTRNGHIMRCEWREGKPYGPVHFTSHTYQTPETRWAQGIMVSWATRSEEGTPREGGVQHSDRLLGAIATVDGANAKA